ncbi:MAG TPA: hypothetical protein VKZ53_03550 [Candidatus Angelobacter sp.]|nr:hypothetical protein [Candidatus Angelobacter sp.]
MTLPLAVSGQREDGSHVSGAAETILVNKHGARIRSAVTLEPSMEVRVAMLAPYKWRAAQVVWANSRENEYGIELDQPENFWGVYFPPEDWELRLPAEGVSASDDGEGNGLFKNSLEPVVIEKRPQETLPIPGGGAVVTLRGVAANHLPFQERGLLVAVTDRDASLLIEPLVGLGSKLMVIFGPGTMEDATVSAIAHSREYDRWRVWLRFSRPIEISGKNSPEIEALLSSMDGGDSIH